MNKDHLLLPKSFLPIGFSLDGGYKVNLIEKNLIRLLSIGFDYFNNILRLSLLFFLHTFIVYLNMLL